jgi:hypothetical protein
MQVEIHETTICLNVLLGQVPKQEAFPAPRLTEHRDMCGAPSVGQPNVVPRYLFIRNPIPEIQIAMLLPRFALWTSKTIPNSYDELFEEVRHGFNCADYGGKNG